jgi:hypothetical protein
MPTKLDYKRVAVVQTTGATATSCGTYVMPDETTAFFMARVAAHGATNSAGYMVAATYKRQAAAAPAQVGATTAIATHEDDATWGGAAFGVVSNTVQLQVTGLAATTIDWLVILEVAVYTP